jgi:hypothetical protein
MAIPNRSSGKPILTKSSPLSVAGTKRWNQSTSYLDARISSEGKEHKGGRKAAEQKISYGLP